MTVDNSALATLAAPSAILAESLTLPAHSLVLEAPPELDEA
jgi:hypothetical protein